MSTTQTASIGKEFPYQLNVVLHGLWAIETNDDGIRIVTTDEHHHVIKAGELEKLQFDLKKERHKQYSLKGVNPASPSDFPKDQNPTVKKDLPVNADLAKVRTAIDLPYPREIHSVRTVKTNGEQFYKENFPTTPPEIAAVQILVYDVKDPNALKLFPLDGFPKPNPDNPAITNFHLFAQPDARMKDEIEAEDEPIERAAKIAKKEGNPEKAAKLREGLHFAKAGKRLADAFGLKITPIMTADTPAVDPKIPGLKLEDTIELFERRNSPALSPANCDFLVINNRRGGA